MEIDPNLESDNNHSVSQHSDNSGFLDEDFVTKSITKLSQRNRDVDQRKRLILIYDKPQSSHIKLQLQQLTGDTIEFGHISSVNSGYELLNICVEYNNENENNLNLLNQYLTDHSNFLSTFSEISYHICFDKSYRGTEQDKDQYSTFINHLIKVQGKIIQVSIIGKYSLESTTISQEIQQDINNWPNLRILDLAYNYIPMFSDINFPETLEILNVAGISLKTLEGVILPLELISFIANDNCITSIDNIKFPTSLKTLNLANNRLYFLNYVEWPESLEFLNLSNNRIDNVRNIEFPNNLISLNISQNPIDSIKGCKFPDNLQFLDVSFMPNETMTGIKFPDSLQLLNLQESMINTRGLKLPNEVKYLNLSGDGVNSINPLKLPNSIQILNLSNNNIKTLNKVIFPTDLKCLFISNNLITTLKNVIFPDSLLQLNLEMDPDLMEDKRITNLKDVIFPQSLEILQLGYQSIRSLENIDFPEALKVLDISYNELKLMRNINWIGLNVLDISGNQELIEIDQVNIPRWVKVLRIPSQLVRNLPVDVIERINRKKLMVFKSDPY